MFNSRWLPELFSRAFAAIPDVPIWEWADTAPFLLRKAPEPTYRSKRTPWVRRASDLLRKPWSEGRRIRRLGVKKSSQSGYSEGAMLNPIRWTAKFRPRNCIISLDSQKEVGNIRERLLPTLEDLGQSIFTDNRDDLSKFKLRLRGMDIWFDGSFSAGGFSNKYAPWIFNDEIDLYGEVGEEGNTVENYWTRAKQAEQDGFQVVLSKPSEEGGPIDQFFDRGNQEYWHVPCPHCQDLQPLEWERVEFEHCRDLTQEWDMERVLAETFYRCRKCGGRIEDRHKQWMNDRGVWVPTAKGDPEIVTQHMSDLYSMLSGSSFGHLVNEYLSAEKADNRKLRQTFRQQRLGLAWKERIQRVDSPDVLRLRKAYRRGVIPHAKCALALGMDIGLYTNTRWVVYAFARNGEMWLIDWGHGTGPADVIPIMQTRRYACAETGGHQAIQLAFIDARYRTDEVYETCLLAPKQIYPTIGTPGLAARSISYQQVPGRPLGFGLLKFVNRDAMFDLYVDRIKEQKPPGLWWPENVDEQLVREHCAERLIRHKRTNRVVWEDGHKRPNHYGDASKIALTGIDFFIGGKRSRMVSEIQDRAAEQNYAEELSHPVIDTSA